MLKDFFKYLEAQVQNGSIYVLGAIGQTGSQITESWIKMREHYIYSNYSRAINLWKERLSQGYKNLCAYDCNGLGNKFFLDNKLYDSRTNANGLKNRCEKIDAAQRKAGDWVFKVTLGRATHIGYLTENDIVYESKGRSYGVIKSPFTSGRWNYTGRPLIFKDEIEGGDDVLKNGDSGELVIDLQKKLVFLGYNLGAFGVNKDGVDGKFGGMTETAVKAFQKLKGIPETGQVDYLTIILIDYDVMQKKIAEADNSQELERIIEELNSKLSSIKSIVG